MLVSIAITPISPSVALGLTEQLHASGTYSDGSTSDLTSSVIINWTSARPSVAKITSMGLVIGIARGATLISAYSGPVLGTGTLTVAPAAIESIAISLNPPYSGVGITLRLLAVETYADGSTAIVASGVAWTSSVPSVAAINATNGQTIGGSVGVTTITATVGSLVASTPLSIVANAWGATGNMGTPRYGFTATVLPNRKVLAAGGYLDTGTLGLSEVYDLGTGTWSGTAGGSGPDVGYPTATLLQNGMVLVAGGLVMAEGNIATNSAQLYNPATNTWSATGSFPYPLIYHTATLLPDGTVFAAGGNNAGSSIYPIRDAANYDPVTGTWRPTRNLNTARMNHTATLLPNGKVLVVGGFGGTGSELGSGVTGPLSSAELYDPATSTWTATRSLATAVASQTATSLSNGAVLIAGGQAAGFYTTGIASAVAATEIYDPTTGIWTSTGSLLTGVFNHTATLLPNGTALVAGGQTNTNSSSATVIAEIYDPTTRAWSATGSLMNSLSAGAAVLLPNGTLLDAGAFSAEIYFFPAMISIRRFNPRVAFIRRDCRMLRKRASQTKQCSAK